MDAAYEELNRERKSKKWSLQTVSAISKGIVLATTKSEDKRESMTLPNNCLTLPS
jgi:hypothetical protein